MVWGGEGDDVTGDDDDDGVTAFSSEAVKTNSKNREKNGGTEEKC